MRSLLQAGLCLKGDVRLLPKVPSFNSSICKLTLPVVATGPNDPIDRSASSFGMPKPWVE